MKWIQKVAGVEEHELDNGLRILTKEDHSTPTVVCMVTYLVGSRNEGVPITGSTHLLEHLMFKGSRKFKKESGTSVWTILQTVGATINATTWNDRTNYYERLPNEHLETALEIEADRMEHALLRKEDLDAEMTVVRNEFERKENDPSNILDKHMWAMAYLSHPYHHPTIGWKSDVETVTIEQLQKFYKEYYVPNNAVVTLVGDFNTKTGLEMIERYFGGIPRAPLPPPVRTLEERQQGQRRVVVKRSGEVGIVGVAFKAPPCLHPDSYPLIVLKTIFSHGKNCKLYKEIVDPGLATKVSVDHSLFRDHTLFCIFATLTGQEGHKVMEDLVLHVCDSVKEQVVSEDVLSKAKAALRASHFFRQDGPMSIARSLNRAIAVGDWRYHATFLQMLEQVDAASVQQVARKYLVLDQSTVGYFIPDNTPKKEDWITGTPGALRVSMDADTKQQDASPPKTIPKALMTERVQVSKLPYGGVQVLSCTTETPQVVSLAVSLVGGGRVYANHNNAIAMITTALLDEGTTFRTKFDISAALEEVGASVYFTVDPHRVTGVGRFLRDDLDLVVDCLTEQLRFPKFEQREVEMAVQRRMGALKKSKYSTRDRADRAWKAAMYPRDHPWCRMSIEEELEKTFAITREDIVSFYETNYGMGDVIVVAVGDVDHQAVVSAFDRGWNEWKVTSNCIASPPFPAYGKAECVVVPLKDKASWNVFVGGGVGITREHKDWYPLFVGVYVLGGNFSARLMRTIRDEEGLTYGIGASLMGGDMCDAYWRVSATFAPALLQQGRKRLLELLHTWFEEGIAEEELSTKKTTILGEYRCSFDTTAKIANRLLGNAEEKRPVSYLDDFPKIIEALTVEQVNAAIKKYICLDALVEAMCGTESE